MALERSRPSRTLSNDELTAKAKDLALDLGACRVGISTVETLTGGPPSTDLEYILPGARSAVTFALPLNQDKIREYLAKKDRHGHQHDYNRTNTLATGIAAQMAGYFDHFGCPSVGVLSNEVYREGDGIKRRHMIPNLSHRLLAVRCGVGWFGYSGNVMIPEFGANATLCTMVTTAELEPTEPLPAEENPCECETKECVAVCPSSFLHVGKEDYETVTMGGVEFTYAMRRNYDRCGYVCGGYSGLHPSGRWSTWSPGRFPVPKNDEDLRPVAKEAFTSWAQRPKLDGEVLQQPLLYQAARKDVQLTCGACMLVCAAEPEERERRLKSVRGAGCAIQHPDGRVEVVPAEEAAKHVAAMDPDTRALYEPENPEVFDGIDMIGRARN